MSVIYIEDIDGMKGLPVKHGTLTIRVNKNGRAEVLRKNEFNPRPGRPKTLKRLKDVETVDPNYFNLPFSKDEIRQLYFSLNKTEDQIKAMLLRGELPRNPTGTHRSHPLHNRWRKMMRDRNVQEVCVRWLVSFRHFCLDVGRPPNPGARLMRCDKNKPWQPGNVDWKD